MEIKDLIKCLDNTVQTNNKIYVEGGSFAEKPWIIHNKASKEKFHLFEKKGYVIPNAFKDLLLYSDGIECACSEQQIYGIDTMIEQADLNKDTLIPGVYEFAYFLGDRIYIDSSQIQTGNYIFFEDSPIGEGLLMGCDFSVFLERLILCGFSNYWRWFPTQNQKIFYLQN